MSGLPRKKCTPKRASSNRAEHKTVQTRYDKTKQKIQKKNVRYIGAQNISSYDYKLTIIQMFRIFLQFRKKCDRGKNAIKCGTITKVVSRSKNHETELLQQWS